MARTMSAQGRKLLEELEGRSNTAYRDSANLWTIGVGHLIKPNEQHLITARLSDKEVDDLLTADLMWAEKKVNDLVTARITQNQFDALVSFTFNVGPQAFEDSTLLKEVNAGAEPKDIAFQFLRWNKAGGQVVRGLTNRRKREIGLFTQHIGTLAVVLVLAGALAMLTAWYLSATT